MNRSFLGIVSAVLFTSVGLGVGLLMTNLSTKSEDLLSFAGALLGSALTVFGAMMIVDYQQHQTGRRTRSAFRDLLSIVRSHLQSLEQPIGALAEQPALSRETYLRLLVGAIDDAKNARQWFTPDSADLVQVFGLIGDLDFDETTVRRALVEASFYKAPPTFGDSLEMLKVRLTQIEMLLKA